MRHSRIYTAVGVLVGLATLWLGTSGSVDREDPPAGRAPVATGSSPPAGLGLATRPAAPRLEGERGVLPPAPLAAAPLGADAGLDADAGAGLLEALARAQVERLLEDNAALAAKSVDAYCAATKDLVETQEKRTRERDAALFMAGRADWAGRHGLLHLAASLTERLTKPPGGWRRLGPDAYAGLDFSWMRELLRFDHWSLTAAGPLRDLPPEAVMMETPIPNFVTFQAWAKLRLLKGLHEGDVGAASREVRHLAELCATTGALIGDMSRVAMLGHERGFYEEHQLTQAPALTQRDAQRLRGASFAAVDFLLPGVDPATRAKALRCLPNRCTALIEAMAMTGSVRGLAPGAEAHLQWLRAQPHCDPSLADLALRSPPGRGESLIDSSVTQLEENLALLLDAGAP